MSTVRPAAAPLGDADPSADPSARPRPAAVIVLAAGAGTRMRSRTPKVLHEIAGRSLLGHALHAARGPDPQELLVVVGHGREQVAPQVEELDPAARCVVQHDQGGTAHAVQCALAELHGEPPQELRGTVLVTYADTPLLTAETLVDLTARHVQAARAVSVLTAHVSDPTGYGRIVRDDDGGVQRIVEERDATDTERAVTEVNSGVYAFDAAVLADALSRVTPANAQGELYLTDVLAIARDDGRPVGAVTIDDPWQTEGVNDRLQLVTLAAELNRRIVHRHLRAGVTVLDPASTWVDDTVRLEPDVTLLPGVQLHGDTRVAAGATVGPDSTLTDVDVGPDATVVRTHGTGAVIGAGASVGPFAYLRPGTSLGARGKIGTFVETKNARLDESVKVPHLSYVGDAEVGAHSNIGAGTIFANYDGVAKHRSRVGRHCRTGSDNVFVAPVEIADGAATGAGTVVRRDVPPGALAVSSGAQRNIEDWTPRKRPGTPAAAAAKEAQEAQGERAHTDADRDSAGLHNGVEGTPRPTSTEETHP